MGQETFPDRTGSFTRPQSRHYLPDQNSGTPKVQHGSGTNLSQEPRRDKGLRRTPLPGKSRPLTDRETTGTESLRVRRTPLSR